MKEFFETITYNRQVVQEAETLSLVLPFRRCRGQWSPGRSELPSVSLAAVPAYYIYKGTCVVSGRPDTGVYFQLLPKIYYLADFRMRTETDNSLVPPFRFFLVVDT